MQLNCNFVLIFLPSLSFTFQWLAEHKSSAATILLQALYKSLKYHWNIDRSAFKYDLPILFWLTVTFFKVHEIAMQVIVSLGLYLNELNAKQNQHTILKFPEKMIINFIFPIHSFTIQGTILFLESELFAFLATPYLSLCPFLSLLLLNNWFIILTNTVLFPLFALSLLPLTSLLSLLVPVLCHCFPSSVALNSLIAQLWICYLSDFFHVSIAATLNKWSLSLSSFSCNQMHRLDLKILFYSVSFIFYSACLIRCSFSSSS